VKRKRYHPEADLEITEAAEFLERRRHEAGEKFLREIEDAIERLQREPNLWRVRPGSVRKYTTRNYKYQIWYQVTENEIYIIAVAHPSRKPGYWRKRI
jgi:toxin ParE1/3/4